jgi:hypothetical protein
MLVIFFIILFCELSIIYQMGGLYYSNLFLVLYILYKMPSVQNINHSWLLYLSFLSICFFIDIYHGLTFKAFLSFIYLFSFFSIFPFIRLDTKEKANTLKRMVLISLFFILLYATLNFNMFLQFEFDKVKYYQIFSSYNIIGFLVFFVVVASIELGLSRWYYIIGLFSLSFMPLIFTVYLSLLLYLIYRVFRYSKIIVVSAMPIIFITLYQYIDTNKVFDTNFLNFVTSGRYSLWSDSITLSSNSLLLGYGIEKWELFLNGIKFVNPHNSIFYYILSYGVFIGALLIFLIIFKLIRHNLLFPQDRFIWPIILGFIPFQLLYIDTIGHYSTLSILNLLVFFVFIMKNKERTVKII